MDIYRSLFYKDVVSPDLIQQLGARMDALFMSHKKM
jgi:hypothetical protein